MKTMVVVSLEMMRDPRAFFLAMTALESCISCTTPSLLLSDSESPPIVPMRFFPFDMRELVNAPVLDTTEEVGADDEDEDDTFEQTYI